MRSLTFAAVLALAAPGLSLGQGHRATPAARGPALSRPATPAPATSAPRITRPVPTPTAAPAPPRGTQTGPTVVAAPAPPRGAVVAGPGAVVVAPAPYWWGWGWGYGYYPLYPSPYAPGGAPPAQPSPLSVKFAAAGASSGDGIAGGVSMLVEGRRAGMHASFDGVELSSSDVVSGASPALSLARVGATFAVASAPAFRVRLEAGGSMLSIPSTGVYAAQPYGGTTTFGPDVGISGQIGLVGPIGLEAHARYTPWPVPVTDVRTAAALRAGPVAFTAGWRAIQVSGDGIDGPEGWFDGPELGLQARF